MRQYRPSIEELKKRYATEQARGQMRQRLLEQNPARAARKHAPYKAEPLPLPRSVAECAWISERILRFQNAQRDAFLETHAWWT